VLSVMVFLLHVGRLPLAISRIVSRNRILCEAALTVIPVLANSGNISLTVLLLVQLQA